MMGWGLRWKFEAWGVSSKQYGGFAENGRVCSGSLLYNCLLVSVQMGTLGS